MKVFGAKRPENYSGGVLLVAANSVEEAIMTAAKDPEIDYLFQWWDEEDGSVHFGDFKYLRSSFYPFENWHEIENLVWNGNEPQVIIEGGYTE